MKAEDAKKKPGVFRWRGVLSERRRSVRVAILALLVTACVALSYAQLGFLGIGIPGERVAYAVVLLLPVALGALLLGTVYGVALGFFAGATLFVHALVLPLDYYEVAFVTPSTSLVLMTLCGFLLGLFFAIALRKNPPPVRRIIYIVIVCIFVSWLYSAGFMLNAIYHMIVDIATEATVAGGADEEELVALASSNIATIALRLGSISIQAWVDAGLMALFCCLCDAGDRRLAKHERRIGMRGLFTTWVFVVVMIAFMVTAAVSFVGITKGEEANAGKNMKTQATYLCNQLEESDERTEALAQFVQSTGINPDDITDEGFKQLSDSISIDKLLDGLTPEHDGIVFVAAGYGNVPLSDTLILLSNDKQIGKTKTLGGSLDNDIVNAIENSLESGEVQRVIYDDVKINSIDDLNTLADHVIQTRLAFLYAKSINNYVVTVVMPSDLVFAERGYIMLGTTLMALVLLLAVFIVVALLLSRVVVRRVDETNGVLARITGGDLSARVDVRDTRELESLSDGINETVDALKGWISEAETRMDAELAAAKAIQESALPSIFPPYPDISQFDIYASMNPAKEVGGDFYDFFLIGDGADSSSGKLAFVMADVSGKGVPAALFMMKAKTQIRDYLASGMEIGEAIENANRQLCEGNGASMFVTAWIGVLDYATGHVEYVNAGHNPPLLWQSGSWRWLKEKSGLPLGLYDGLPYQAFSVECGIGDQFLLYTDGVTEAMNVGEELYGEERLKEVADKHFAFHPRLLVEAVRHDVARHASGAEQSDDITILALEVGVPPEMAATLIVPANVTELPQVNDFIHTELDRRLCPVRAQKQLDIAVEELFVNVCHYAYPDATPANPGMVRITYTYSADPPSIIVDIVDEGIPYDPLAKPDAVTPDDIMDVPIGGLGILMAKRNVNEMRYERANGNNIVTIVKKW